MSENMTDARKGAGLASTLRAIRDRGYLNSDDFARLDEIAAALAPPSGEVSELVESLRAVLPYVATQAVGCHGDKCREPWCYSCFGEDEADEAAARGASAYRAAHDALARAQSLTAAGVAPAGEDRPLTCWEQQSLTECRTAWNAVCDALEEVAPGWIVGEGSGKERAVATIRRLSAAPSGDVGRLVETVAITLHRQHYGEPSGWTGWEGETDEAKAYFRKQADELAAALAQGQREGYDARFARMFPAPVADKADDPNGQHCPECRFTMSGLGYCVNCPSPAAPVGAQAGEWVSVDDRLPSVGDWCAIFIDQSTGDYWDQQKSSYVTAASLRHVDSEGNPYWEQGQLGSGHPLRTFNLVTHWQPLPAAPSAATGQPEGQEGGVSAERREDMSPTGCLRLHAQDDGDMVLTVTDERGSTASVEFCASGGQSPQTLQALRALSRAMQADAAPPARNPR